MLTTMDHKLSITILLLIISLMVHLGNCGDINLGDLMKGGEEGNSIASLPCLPKLLPCQAFLGSDKVPTATCCGPLKTIIEEETKCLCQAFQNPAMLASFNVTKEDVLKLPKACGLDANEDICKSAVSSAPNSSPEKNNSNSSSSSDANSTDSPDAPTTATSSSSSSPNNAAKGAAYLSGYSITAFLVALIVSA